VNRRTPPGQLRAPSRRQQKLAAKKLAKASLDFMGPVDLSSKRIADAVRKAAAETREKFLDADQFFISAAELVISECLRFEPRSPQAQDFFRKPELGTVASWKYSARVFSVADALFQLRNCDGFDVLCAKAPRTDLRATVAELYAARMFDEAGFKVSARPEMNIKRYDYDFSATREFRRTNVEVTAFDEKPYASAAVFNGLRYERKQVPENAPAVVFAYVPHAWFADPDIDAKLKSDAEQFFYGKGDYKGTGAVNAVVFMNEHYEDMGGKGRLLFSFQTVINLSARHPCDDVLPLIDGSIDKAESMAKADVFDIEFLRSSEKRGSEFFKWAGNIWDENNAR
jgi:hypothetical protein